MSNNLLAKQYDKWQPWLSWFDASLQPIIAELLSQLNLLLGPQNQKQLLAQDYFAGLSSLRQKGLYQNLLLSEWLLADEEPDEFIRRAACSEHLFLAPDKQKSKANNCIIALFDAGILQLGPARIVHIVMMLLLDCRAKKHHSQFLWGVIQQSSSLTQFSGLDCLNTLLAGRNLAQVTPENLNSWLDNCPEHDECWFVGSSMSVKHPMITHYVNTDMAVGEQWALNVTVASKRQSRSCRLNLPHMSVCEKILSGKWGPENIQSTIVKKSLVAIDIYSVPSISLTGNHFAILTHDKQHVLFCALSDISSKKQKCHVNFYHITEPAIEFDFQSKKLIGLMQKDDEVLLWWPNKTRANLTLKHQDLFAKSNRFLWVYDNHSTSVYLIDKEGELLRYHMNSFNTSKACPGIKIKTGVLGLFKLSSHNFLYVSQEENGEILLKISSSPKFSSSLGQLNGVIKQIFISDESGWLKGSGVIAINQAEDWLLFEHDVETKNKISNQFLNADVACEKSMLKQHIRPPANWQVFGLHYDKTHQNLAFIMIHQDRQRIALYWRETLKIEEIYYSKVKIICFNYCSIAKTLVLTTGSGELIVYSLLSGTVRLNLSKS